MNATLSLPDGSSLALDRHGHLVDPSLWRPGVAEAFAALDGVSLADAHWVVLEVLREFHAEFGIEPPMRALLQRLRERLECPDLASRDLYRWFPEGPIRQGSRYAGLPLPLSCI